LKRENLVADALSRKEKIGQCQAISAIIPKWMKEVAGSYEQTPWIRDLMANLTMQSSRPLGYTLTNGLM